MADRTQQTLHEKLFPESVKTDHEQFTIGDLLVLVMSGFLLLFTIYFSWDFLNRSMPVEYKILSIAGLWGLDIGVIFWSLTYIFGSTAKWQDFISIAMLAIDYIGVALTTIVGFLTGRGSSVPALVSMVTLYGVVGIILINILAGVVYHLASPQTAYRRERRKMRSDLEADEQRGKIELEKKRRQLRLDEDMVKERQIIVAKEKELAAANIALDAIERQTLKHLNFAAPPSAVVPTGNGHEKERQLNADAEAPKNAVTPRQ